MKPQGLKLLPGTPDFELFLPLGIPRRGDWLAEHKEADPLERHQHLAQGVDQNGAHKEGFIPRRHGLEDTALFQENSERRSEFCF